MHYRKNFPGTEKQVRMSHGKRAIGVQVIEVLLVFAGLHTPSSQKLTIYKGHSEVYKPLNDPCRLSVSGERMFTILVNRLEVCLFVLRFYGPVNPMGSCRARSVYLTTRLLGRLSPLSG